MHIIIYYEFKWIYQIQIMKIKRKLAWFIWKLSVMKSWKVYVVNKCYNYRYTLPCGDFEAYMKLLFFIVLSQYSISTLLIHILSLNLVFLILLLFHLYFLRSIPHPESFFVHLSSHHVHSSYYYSLNTDAPSLSLFLTLACLPVSSFHHSSLWHTLVVY